MKNIFISTGEKSGELIIKPVISKLKKKFKENLYITAMCGHYLKPFVDRQIIDSRDFGLIGFYEAVLKYRILKKKQTEVVHHLRKHRYDLVILVDYIGFNLQIGRAAKDIGIPVLLYVGPQIWAWKKNRIKSIPSCVDYLALILPFEEKLYVDTPIFAKYVGNPLTENLPKNYDKKTVKGNYFQNGDQKKVISFLPGSRLSEIRSHIDTIFDCITELGIIYPHAKFIIALSDKLDVTEEISESCRDLNKKNIDVVLEVAKTHNVILASDIVISCSGTASLEVALLKTPLIIFYKTSFISYLIFKTVSLVKFIGLPNLIMEEKVVPELVQDKFNTKNLTHETIKILESQEIRDSQIEAFNLVEKKLSGKNATDNVFKIIDKILLGARF